MRITSLLVASMLLAFWLNEVRGEGPLLECGNFNSSCQACMSQPGCTFCADNGGCVNSTSNVFEECLTTINSLERCNACTITHLSCSGCAGNPDAITSGCAWCQEQNQCILASAALDYPLCNGTLWVKPSDCVNSDNQPIPNVRPVIIITVGVILCVAIPIAAFSICTILRRIQNEKESKYFDETRGLINATPPGTPGRTLKRYGSFSSNGSAKGSAPTRLVL